MPDYTKGKIYKIYNDSMPNKCYYGSTIQPLSKRLSTHKKIYKDCTSKQLFEQKGAKIVLVENVICNNKEELEKRERFYIENNKCVNKKIPGRTKKEYYKDNKDKKKIINKKYRNDNKEKIALQKKQYSITNKEKIALYKKQYGEDNKEKIKLKAQEKIGCKVCKCMVRKDGFKEHTSTKKHINNLL
ncbi:MAG: hypothetical protein H8E55_66330 [Pelagibacterales bacterium]|nr:hypothetical protein [Pelagibacterales bacterium]